MDVDLGLEIYHTIGAAADRIGVDAYAVGGVVRDHFLQLGAVRFGVAAPV